tara:strand:+ start:1531 stop:1803 length:273 start_codon:yes stop_codon:yes gene_type:complete
MSESTITGVKYNVGDGQWVTDTNVPAHVTTIEQFINYLSTDCGVDVPANSSITMNLRNVNRNADLAPNNSEDTLVWVAFMSNDKTGGDAR